MIRLKHWCCNSEISCLKINEWAMLNPLVLEDCPELSEPRVNPTESAISGVGKDKLLSLFPSFIQLQNKLIVE